MKTSEMIESILSCCSPEDRVEVHVKSYPHSFGYETAEALRAIMESHGLSLGWATLHSEAGLAIIQGEKNLTIPAAVAIAVVSALEDLGCEVQVARPFSEVTCNQTKTMNNQCQVTPLERLKSQIREKCPNQPEGEPFLVEPREDSIRVVSHDGHIHTLCASEVGGGVAACRLLIEEGFATSTRPPTIDTLLGERAELIRVLKEITSERDALAFELTENGPQRTMRAKMTVEAVLTNANPPTVEERFDGNQRTRTEVSHVQNQQIKFRAVCKTEGYPEDGHDENNSFARWSPQATMDITIQNPNLFGKLVEGQEYYLDFYPAPAKAEVPNEGGY